MRLRELQREMQREILGAPSAIAQAIAASPPLTTPARLGIYQHAYQARLIEALDDSYEVLHELLGDDTFETLGTLFIAAHPSTHRSLRWWGGELADFLEATAPFSGQPILAEVARFEWALGEAFDSADAAVLVRADLEAVDPARWPELRFSFHASVRRLTLEWNAVAVWKAVSAKAEPPEPERNAEPVKWLLWRQDLENYFRSIDAVESAALEAALGGSSFAEICAALGEELPADQVPPRAAALIAAWTGGGLVTKVA